MDSLSIALISAITSIVGAFIAGISAYLSYYFKRKDGKAELERELNRILEIVIQYPRFEYPPFTNDWPNHRNEDNEIYLRYDIYCNMIYNFLYHVYDYFGGKQDKIEKFIDVRTWIRVHRQNWQHPADDNENIDGYDDAFRQFINSYIQ